MHEPDAGLVALGMQRDLDGRRARRDRVSLLLPSEGEDDLLHRHDLEVLARRLVLTADEHPVHAAGPRVDLRDGALPLDVACGVGEERPDRLGGGVDHDLANELGHQLLPFVCRFAVLRRLGDVAQPLEARCPVVVEERAQLRHRVGVRPVEPAGAVAPLGHEVGLLEHGQVLRDRRTGDVAKLVGDVGGRQLLRPHQAQDRPAPRLGERLEGGVHTRHVSRVLT